jgi:hypothetical protein
MPEQEIVKQKATELAPKLEKVYQLLKWKWWHCGIPLQSEIIETFMELYKEVKDHKVPYRIESGGLFIRKYQEEEGDQYIELGMTIDEIMYIPTLKGEPCQNKPKP